MASNLVNLPKYVQLTSKVLSPEFYVDYRLHYIQYQVY